MPAATPTLSVLIPCYNEMATLPELLRRVEAADAGPVHKEIILVDDGSTDGTREFLATLQGRHTVLLHDKNQGKGAAIRTGLAAATGDFILVQDADLEYNPDNYIELLQPLLQKQTKVVYGSRIRNRKNKRHSGYGYYAGGVFLSKLTNLLYGSDITDEPTCYKVFEANLLKSIPLSCTGFEFCPEVTAKVLRRGQQIVEVPIDYFPRKASEGKKIRLSDGIEAIWTLLKYRFVK